MDIAAVIVTLIVGAIAGWLAGVIVEGAGFGLLINMLLGIAGAFIAAVLFPRLGLGLTLGGGVVGAIITSALGAIVLLLIVNLVQRLVN
jgi:uncharacterized membrane protein YeaQ/YmgE (transglycosylase-associated protein family)